MRGEERRQRAMLMIMKPGDRVPREHPLRRVKELADAGLAQLSPLFDEMYSLIGRPSIPPERVAEGLAADGALLRVLNFVFLGKAALLSYVSFVLGVAVLLLLSTAEVSAQTAPTGKVDYRNYCASCHGIDGAGDKEADIPGPDLTHLSKKNGGRFPFQEVYEVIDGRKKAAAHERLLDMPLWGVYFQPQGVSKGASEAKVKSRITDLVRYIQSLQETQSPQQR